MKRLYSILFLSALPTLMSAAPSGTTHGPAMPAPGPGSLAIEEHEPPIPPGQLEVERVVFLEIEIPGFGVVKVKVILCKQGTSGCP